MGRPGSLLLIGAVLLVACSSLGLDSTTTGPPTTLGPSVEALSYLDDALRELQEQSVYTHLDWDMIEEAAHANAADAQTPADTYPAIELAIRLLADNSSSFFTPLEVAGFFQEPADFDQPSVQLLPDGVGYVSIGKFFGDVGDEADSYATDVAAQIDGLIEDTCGWVVDLRTATFGNPWPALGALAPLLTLGKIGGFSHADGSVGVWESTGGAVTLDGEVMVRNGRTTPSPADQPIAVLVSPVTGHPGEAAAGAFSGQSDVRSFGQPTRGHTGSLDHIELSDGAVISIITGSFTDRLGMVYGPSGPFVPDESTPNPTSTQALAMDWLLSHPTCQTLNG